MWKTILGHEVYIEDGHIIRGTRADNNGSQVAAYVYRHVKDGWEKEDKITEAAFRSGVNRGTITMK